MRIKQRILVIISWIISNIIWTIIILPLTFGFDLLTRDNIGQVMLKDYLVLLASGILQGLIISICQGSVLWLFKLPKKKIIKLSSANIISSIVAMIMLAIYVNISGNNYDYLLLVIIWNLSLSLVGAAWGITAGNSRFQQVDWAISTGFAYPLWSTASLIIVFCFSSPALLSNPSHLYLTLIFVITFYATGFGLNIPKVIELLNKHQNY